MQTVFPLIYLLMKRHYEIMRAMRTRVLDSRELWNGADSLFYVKYAIRYRMNDLTSTSSPISLLALYRLPCRRTQTTFPNNALTPRNSSSISVMRKIYGLQTMSELSIH